MTGVREKLIGLAPRAAREQAKAIFGKRFETWVRRSELPITEVAEAMALQGPHLHEVFKGARGLRMSLLFVLPPPVLRVLLEDLAASIGYELRPVEESSRVDGMKTALNVMREVADVLHSTSDIESGGGDVRRKALDGVREIEEAERALAERKAHLRQLGESGVAPVHSIKGAKS